MPTYVALRCFSCKVFQSKQKTKTPKFNCVMCGAKQSVQRVYASSEHPKDVREAVQQLNAAAGEQQEMAAHAMVHRLETPGHQYAASSADWESSADSSLPLRDPRGRSRWSAYVGESDAADDHPSSSASAPTAPNGYYPSHRGVVDDYDLDDVEVDYVLADPNRYGNRKRKAPRQQLSSAATGQRRRPNSRFGRHDQLSGDGFGEHGEDDDELLRPQQHRPPPMAPPIVASSSVMAARSQLSLAQATAAEAAAPGPSGFEHPSATAALSYHNTSENAYDPGYGVPSNIVQQPSSLAQPTRTLPPPPAYPAATSLSAAAPRSAVATGVDGVYSQTSSLPPSQSRAQPQPQPAVSNPGVSSASRVAEPSSAAVRAQQAMSPQAKASSSKPASSLPSGLSFRSVVGSSSSSNSGAGVGTGTGPGPGIVGQRVVAPQPQSHVLVMPKLPPEPQSRARAAAANPGPAVSGGSSRWAKYLKASSAAEGGEDEDAEYDDEYE